MQYAYDIITRARDLLAENPETVLKEATKKDYAAKVKRLMSKLGPDKSPHALIQEALKTTKISSWQSNRAAIRDRILTVLRKDMATQDKLQRGLKALAAAGETPDHTVWLKVVDSIHVKTNAVYELRDAVLPLEGREDRHSKRQDISGLPSDWCERIIARMPKYYAQALVTAVTGCRPAELVTGVELAIHSSGYLEVRIYGAKTSKTSGQAWRVLSWPPDTQSKLVRKLFDLVGQHPPGCSFTVTLDSAKAFSGAMTEAGKREWRTRKSAITPYCMRHQVAADMKAAGWLSSSEISMALGHVSDVTKSRYGHANMGRRGGSVAPATVTAARPVRIKKPSQAAAKRAQKGNAPTQLNESWGMAP